MILKLDGIVHRKNLLDVLGKTSLAVGSVDKSEGIHY